jgi:hypothetical protein
LRLSEASQATINDKEEKTGAAKGFYYFITHIVFSKKDDTISSIFAMIREVCTQKGEEKTAGVKEIERRVLKKGFKKEDLTTAIEQYTKLHVLFMNDNRTQITLI